MQRARQRVIRFLAEQAAKSARQPIRLIYTPYRILRRFLTTALHYCLVVAVRLNLPVAVIPKFLAPAEAEYQIRRAQELLDDNRPKESWNAFKRGLEFTDDPSRLKIAAVCLHVGLGRMREAIKLYRRSNQVRMARSASAKISIDEGCCILDDFWALHIGHSAQIDYVVKLRMLNGNKPDQTILYVPRLSGSANRFLIEQWRSHLRVLTGSELPFSKKLIDSLALDFYVQDVPGKGTFYMWEVAALTYRRWAAEGRAPILKLSEDVKNLGREALASVGVPRDAWFVGLHVREPHFQTHHRDLHGVLNAKIEDYLPAIREITRMGGWVIRMGDPSMSPLAPLPNVLDYCHSSVRSDWMDVFLCAVSRFFIGTASGVCYVANDYGIPCLLTNWWPPAQRPWHACDIFIPKVLRRMKDGRMLSLEESLNEPFGYCNSVAYLQEEHGVSVQDNDPEDIRAAVIEMLERVEGRAVYDADDVAKRECAEHTYASVAMQLYGSPAAFGAGSLAREFVRRNPCFVEPR